MKKVLICIIFIFSIFYANADEKISKLNELYLNGVLDKSSYLASLENIGIKTSNEIFINLFDLFSDSTLDLESYEKSLVNLITLSNQNNLTNESMISEIQQINNDQIIKEYKIINCKGDSSICEFLEQSYLPFFMEDKQIVVDRETIQAFVDGDNSLLRITLTKNFSKNDTFTHIITIRHVRGFLLDFKFTGYLEGDDFFMTGMSLTANGKEMNSSDLELI
jgi:hypothetical protein